MFLATFVTINKSQLNYVYQLHIFWSIFVVVLILLVLSAVCCASSIICKQFVEPDDIKYRVKNAKGTAGATMTTMPTPLKKGARLQISEVKAYQEVNHFFLNTIIICFVQLTMGNRQPTIASKAATTTLEGKTDQQDEPTGAEGN